MLRRVSLERELSDNPIHTQQKIIEIAVAEWLRRESGQT